MPKIIDSLYLHFPFCSHLCNYCDFYKKVSHNKVFDYQNYHSYLEHSFLLHNNLIEKFGYCWEPLKTLYIGGGTPSLWGVEGKNFLPKFLYDRKIDLADDCEFTLEVNPGAWTEEVLDEWRKFGANRFSLGVQSLDAQMIQYLDRVHSIQDVFNTLEYFGKNNLNFSIDFMIGLPYSKELKRDIIGELEKALSYKPSHFSVYILTVKENYTHFSKLPSEEWIEREFLEVADFLFKNDFEHYEVSNFSLRGKQSRHNLNYWESKTVAALGPSATGFLSEDRIRYKWKTNNPEIEIENLTEEEFRLEKVYMSLRSSEGILINDFPAQFENLLSLWLARGLVTTDQKKIFLTSKGYLMLDSLIGDLFARELL